MPFGPHTVARMIEDVFERHVLGRGPLPDRAPVAARLLRAATRQRPDLSLMGVLSGIEMACWDIVGKELGKPVYELLGGRVHERLRSYTLSLSRAGRRRPASTAIPSSPPSARPSTSPRASRAVKFDPVGPYSAFDPRQLSLEALERAERFVKTLREAVGGQCDLLFGTHGQITASGAIRLARRLEPYDPCGSRSRRRPRCRRRWRRSRARPASRSRPASAWRPSTSSPACSRPAPPRSCRWRSGRVGGMLEAKKIAGMAEAHYAQIAPHLYCGPVEGAANIQLAACSPNFLILESIQTWGGFHAEILKQPIALGGRLRHPAGRARASASSSTRRSRRAHPYTGKELHLEMHDRPL